VPPPERAKLTQKAIVWLAEGTDRYGDPKVSDTPIEIRVRWITGRMESLDANGNVMALEATAIVKREIPVGSRMWLGSLAEFMGTGSAGADTEIMEVKIYNEVPDEKGRNRTRSVGMMRFHDEKPPS
jgi:hypothetical protein